MDNKVFNRFTDAEHSHKLIHPLLLAFNNASADIESSVVISRDGLTIAAALNNNIDANRSGAMCASLLALAETAAAEFKRGKLKQVMLDCEHGFVVVVHIGTDAALAVITQDTINVGMIFIKARQAAQQIADILSTDTSNAN